MCAYRTLPCPGEVVAHHILPLLNLHEMVALAVVSRCFAQDVHAAVRVRLRQARPRCLPWEQRWIDAVVRGGQRVRSWLPSLYWRWLRPQTFERRLHTDVRLTAADRVVLTRCVRDWEHRSQSDHTVWEWYIRSVLPHLPIKEAGWGRGVRAAFELPRLELRVGESRLTVHHGRESLITLRRRNALVGCLDELNTLWQTALWTPSDTQWMEAVAQHPLVSVARYCPRCPVCNRRCQWSPECSLQYAHWGGSVLRQRGSAVPFPASKLVCPRATRAHSLPKRPFLLRKKFSSVDQPCATRDSSTDGVRLSANPTLPHSPTILSKKKSKCFLTKVKTVAL